jgi:branched-chain amino acid transport system substrate-binding protein
MGMQTLGAAALAFAALATSACGPTLRAQEAVAVGVLAPLNSGVPAAARSVVQGATLAADEVNAAAGASGASIALIVQDDRGTADEAARQYDYLVNQKVVAIVGPLTDAAALALAPMAERAGVPLISPGATGTIPYAGSAFFRTSLSAEAQARRLADFLVNRRRARRVAIIHDSNEYGTMVALAFAERIRMLGAAVVGTRLYHDGDTDFTRHVTGVFADSADAVFIAGYPDEGALIVRALKERGAQLPIVGSDALYSSDLVAWASAYAEDVLLPAPFVAGDPLPIVQEFVGKYRSRFNDAPDHFAAQSYDAVKMLASAMRRGERRPAAIRAALQGMRKFPGVTGEITLDRWGTPARPVAVARVRRGQFEIVER